MTSSIYFKVGYEKDISKINFTGNQISLKDLKEQIIQSKNLTSGKADWDLDLLVTDAVDTSKGMCLSLIYNHYVDTCKLLITINK